MKSIEEAFGSSNMSTRVKRIGATGLLVVGLSGATSACGSSRPCEAEIPLSSANEMTTTTIHLPDEDVVYASAFRVDNSDVKLTITKTPVGGKLMSKVMTEGTETASVQYPLGVSDSLHFELKDSEISSFCTPVKAQS